MGLGFRRSPFRFKSAGAGLLAESLAYFAAGSITSDSERTAVNNLVVGLKAAGIYPKLNRMWLVSPTSSTAARLDFITLQSLTTLVGVCGAPSYNFATGWSVGAAQGGFDSGFNENHTANPSSLVTLSSGHYSIYIKNPSQGTYLGATDGNAYTNISSSCGLQANISTNSGFVNDIVTCDTNGFYTVSRTSANIVTFYIDGVENQATAVSGTSTLANENIYIGGMNSAGTPVDFGDWNFTWATAGSGLNGTESADLNTLGRAYLTAVGHI
jgi:hypothetical protein